MARKATRLRFTKEELASPKVRQAAARAEKAADKADRAAEKTPKRRRLKLKADKTAERKVHLSFPTPFTGRLLRTTRMKTRPCRRRTPQRE